MIIPNKKLKSGFSMPSFGVGTWQMGGRHDHNPQNDDGADVAALRAAIDMGVTHIDTAEQYAAGYAEMPVGRAIEGFDRSKLFLISKAMPAGKGYNEYIDACKASLQRMQTEYLDMYLLHRVPDNLKESMRAMNTLVDQGLIRHIGVANFGVESFQRAQSLTPHQIPYNQVHYNLEFREPERTGLLKYCQENDILLAGWRPVQKGALLKNPPQILVDMCQKYKKTSAQIAINWLLSQEHVITLVKTSNVEHLKENVGAIGWMMETEDIELLRHAYPNQKDVSDAVPLG
ncbi:aldo/keto reductase [Candidatus Kaiserbacteria bacterium]|nr:aldo/keto reductase [Candidatus Kaiserbacteria bacterium]